jgi:hypothetical protein
MELVPMCPELVGETSRLQCTDKAVNLVEQSPDKMNRMRRVPTN